MMETTNLWNAFEVLRRRFWIILLLLAVTMGVILYRAWTTPPVYRSSVVLQVIPLEPEEVTLYTRLNTVSSADTIDLILFQFGNLIRNTRIAQRALEETGIPMSAGTAVAGMSVDRDPAGDLVTVSMAAASPADAEKLVVRQVELALEEFRQSRALPSEASGKFLEGELAAAEQALEQAREVLLNFKLTNGVEYLDREIIAAQDAVRALNEAQETAGLAVRRLEAVVAELEKQIQEAQTKAAAATPNSPDGAYWLRVVQDLNTVVLGQRAEAAGQRAEAEASGALLARRQTDLATLITLTREHQRLEDAAQDRQDTRDFLAAKAREARLKESQSRTIGYLQPVGEPTTPRDQIGTRTVQIALLGALLSIVGGAIIALALEFIEKSLRRRRATAARGDAPGRQPDNPTGA